MLTPYQIKYRRVWLACYDFITNQAFSSGLFKARFYGCNNHAISGSPVTILHCESILIGDYPLSASLNIHTGESNFGVRNIEVNSCYHSSDILIELIVFNILISHVIIALKFLITMSTANCLNSMRPQLFSHLVHAYVPHFLAVW